MRVMKYIIVIMLFVIMEGCAIKTKEKEKYAPKQTVKYELGEYLYLEIEEGLICHIDPDCGKHCTYIKTDKVLSMVQKCKKSDEYYRDGRSASHGVLIGNYHFCSKCIPLSIMQEIEEKTNL